ncbi:transcriptional regulator [Planomonospora parontospora subsp. parontospora]|uniref:Transcriptional regulator n=2 Tax=Planomonospora parontospora TaxID=58119 RepID=A0AA37BMB1_9ACTN|nr:helix-turn-helix transcriptional regulator [Planomonospora parontospora]GGK90767.1 transcriptional regulator [Planomonospora parontospora]GII11959.1 transcriptional regulator [Planomonospora parontospora subsp. parontospora]
MARISPPLRLEKLGEHLRDLRDGRGLKLSDAAAATGMSVAKISRMENGTNQVTSGDVDNLLDVYEADEGTRIVCMQLVEQSQLPPWWKSHQKALYTPYIALETEAREKRSWQPLLIPGLLQTPEYARAVIAADRPWETTDLLTMLVRARMARKWVLTCDDPLMMHVVIGEEALRRPTGGQEVMARQLDHLLQVVERPNITVRIMPSSVGAHAGMAGPFLLLTFPDMPTALFRESGADGMIDQGPQVEEFEKRWHHIVAAALPPEASMDLIASIRGEAAHADLAVDHRV